MADEEEVELGEEQAEPERELTPEEKVRACGRTKCRRVVSATIRLLSNTRMRLLCCAKMLSQIAELKMMLSNGDLGPAEFEQLFQELWLSMKKDEAGDTLAEKRRARQSMIAQRSMYIADDE